jgi:uncharacterized membrane protein
MQFDYALPFWALALVIAAAALMAFNSYAGTIVPLSPRRRAVLTSLRCAALLALVLILFRPTLANPSEERSEGVVPILVDVSRSMALEDADGGTRIERASDLLRHDLLPGLQRSFQTEVITFGDETQTGDAGALAAVATRTRLAAALGDVAERYRGRRVAGVVVLSDGGETGGAGVRSVTDSRAFPVFAVGIGSPAIGMDREVVSVSAGERVLADSLVELSAAIVSRGYGDDPIEVRLLANGQPVDMKRVSPNADGSPVRAIFRIAASADAPTLYTVETPPEPGELTPENNWRSVIVDPPGRKRRILFVQGAPGFDHAFLSRALQRDEGLEVDWVVRKGTNDMGAPTFYVQAPSNRSTALGGGFPATREALFSYDGLLLGNLEWHRLGHEQLRMIADFVAQRGGGLLVFGARSFTDVTLAGTPLEEVLPVAFDERASVLTTSRDGQEASNRLAMTAAGEEHAVMRLDPGHDENLRRWAGLPALAGISPLGRPRAGASVLAAAAGSPVRPAVVVQRYGEGRSMVFAGEASWRWRMLLPSSDRSYETFWRQAARWVAGGAPEPVTILSVDDAAPGEAVSLDVVARDAAFEPVRDASVTMRVVLPGGETRELSPVLADAGAGRYSSAIAVERPGVYRVTAEVRQGASSLGRSERWFLAGGFDPEFADPRLNEDVLRRLAASSGGQYFGENHIGGLLPSIERVAPDPPEPGRRDAWHSWWVFGAVALLLSTEWTLRRRWGLR